MIGGHCIDVRKLEYAQPLAYRVLRRIQVACPFLEKHGCTWKGDYEDLTEHLLSENAHQAWGKDNKNREYSSNFSGRPPLKRPKPKDGIENSETHNEDEIAKSNSHVNLNLSMKNIDETNHRLELTESFKLQANSKFADANFMEARDLYSKSISVVTGKNDLFSSDTLSDEENQMLASLFANRAAAHLQLKEFVSCIKDSESCVKLDKKYVKVCFLF